MTFILGLCGFGPGVPKGSTERMSAAQQQLAPDGVTIRKLGEASFARGLYRLLDEDVYDDQPYLSADGRLILCVDARIDNRAELFERLNLYRNVQISDSELVARAYERFGEKVVDKLRGDFAIAAWDESERRLTLARDYTGQRPLNYHVGNGFVAFASMPHALLANEMIRADPDKRQWAEFFADIPRSGSRTYFKDIKRVEPGHVVNIDPGGTTSRPYWSVPERRIEYRHDEQYALALREKLERAVAARLRGASGTVGTHLSAGLDSGAVTTTAAELLKPKGGRVLAFTGAPRAGFGGPLPRGRALGDESEIAQRVASYHANIEHVVVRAEGVSPLDIARRDSGLFGEPLGLPCNQVWWSAVVEAAQERGLKVLLTGESGNHAFSSGGLPTLAEFVIDRKWRLLLEESIELHRRGTRWQGVMGSAFGPWIPPRVWGALHRWKWGRSMSQQGSALLTREVRALLPNDAALLSRASPPSRNARQARAEFLQHVDPGVFRLATLGQWGIEERDPTTDRELVEFCFSLPPEQLLRKGVTRALARSAMSDRLPAEALHAPRGYQGADWFERVDGADVDDAARELKLRLNPNEIVDLQAVRNLAATWPSDNWASGTIISTYRYALLRAVSAGYFLASFKSVGAARSLRAEVPNSKGAA